MSLDCCCDGFCAIVWVVTKILFFVFFIFRGGMCKGLSETLTVDL